ncbi:hypothetical protein N7532_002301 [Penicillium argentinense]|uniref:DUF7514 domain-containing protein n=1 Tax=Penicillium argentinense TaxID=1131581 RepID=A0A9W9G086_9EURO|nr:uncharacterized protein N7532_002301 [Penicillium argentinense]KAJ5109656.1 hypothetical protein N7532_002301 [Penicillium argentinense]
MSSAANSWGTLINPDKSPAPLLEQLCLGIAQLMPSFDNNGTADLTPDRLAAFYRKVGGNYDSLFLETKAQALSFIYQSVGCFHSLQPSTNPYEPPSVPSLLPLGFVRWQTIQLLMDPDEHSRYLQNAVSQWDIIDAKGDVFPKEIPRDAFPSEPDPEMLQWHEGVCRKLEYDFVKRQANRASPPNFGAYHYHFSGKESLPDEEDYFSHPPRRSSSHRHGRYDSDRSSRRRHHHRRLSGDHHSSSSRRSDRLDPSFVPRPDGGRSGMSTPRGQSPSRPDRPPRSRGRDRATWYGHPLSPGAEEPVFPDIAESEPAEDISPPTPKHKFRPRHNLSPPPHTRARRHSHDAYTRKPTRDFSPTAPHRSYDSRPVKSPPPRMTHSEAAAKARRDDRDRSRSRGPGVKFREWIFDHVPAPAPDPPQYTQPIPSPHPRVQPRHRYNLEPDDRRGSHSAGSSGSRPNSGGSGSDRPRSFSNVGPNRAARWTSPSRSAAAKRYIPSLVEGDLYAPAPGPGPGRRTFYD